MTETTLTVFDLIGLLGSSGVAVLLVALGLISRRLGLATRAKPYFYGLFAAAGLLLISVAVQALNLLLGLATRAEQAASYAWVLAINGLPALAFTLALYVAWRYWSWLLAERD